MSQAILDKLKNSIVELDAGMAEAAAKEAVAAGIAPMDAIENGLAGGMGALSEQFDEGEVFIPQLLLAAKAFDAAVAILTGSMSAEDRAASSRGKILIHTVSGDIHSIGKNICATMLGASGFEVIDLGVDVPTDLVVDKAVEHKVNVIAGSALMTTTMPAMKEIESILKERGIRGQFKTIYGGAPVLPDFIEAIGADGYAETATGAVKECLRLCAK